MKLYIKIIENQSEESKQLLREYYNNYNKKYITDSGIDLVIPYNILCKWGETTSINLGISCQPDQLTGYYLYPRSSLSSTPLRLSNSLGIIDYSYTGPLIAKVDNFNPKLNSDYQINGLEKDNNGNYKYIKLFQLCMPNLQPFTFELIEELKETDRGSNGFGSTNY